MKDEIAIPILESAESLVSDILEERDPQPEMRVLARLLRKALGEDSGPVAAEHVGCEPGKERLL